MAIIAATKTPWLMQTLLSLKCLKGSMTVINLFQSDGNGSDKIDILDKFEETEKTRKIVLGRAMKHKALISTKKWDDVAKDRDKIEAASDKFMYYQSEFNSTQHSIAEAKYGQDLENPFGGVWFLLTCTAEKHEQKRIDVMLEKLTQYVDSACKRAVDMAAYLQKINIWFLSSSKPGQTQMYFTLAHYPESLARSVTVATLEPTACIALSGKKQVSRQLLGGQAR